MRLVVFIFAVLACVVPHTAYPAVMADTLAVRDSVTEIDEVVIMERRNVRGLRSTAPLQVVSRQAMMKMNVFQVSDAVKHFGGVTVKDYGGIGGLKTVSVRSLGAAHTAVSYDGITISDCQTGQIDIGRFSLDNVESVSLWSGQSDDIFMPARQMGAASLLDIRSSVPEFVGKPVNGRVALKGGSFGLVNPSVLYNQKVTDNTSLSFYGDFLRADGNYPFKMWNGNTLIDSKRNNSDIRTYRAEATLYTSFTPKQDLQVKAYLFDSERGLPGGVIYDNPYAAERLFDKNYFGQFRYENRFSDRLKLQALGKFNYSWNRDYNDEASGITDDRYRQTETYLSATLWGDLGKGFSLSLAQDFAYNYLHTTLDQCQFPQRYTLLTALGAQYQRNSFTATASLLNTYITEDVRIGTAAADRKRLSPAFSVSWKPFEEIGLRFRASYKDIFRTPTFNDLYYLVIGNSSLRPETTKQGNLGVTWSGSKLGFLDFLSLSADTYYNKVKDKIVAVPTMFVWKMMNVGKVETIGVDVNLSAESRVTDWLKFYLTTNYSFMQAEDVTDPDSKTWRNQIVYTPRHSGSGNFTIETPWINLSYNLTYASERYTLAQNLPDYRIKPYSDHGISLSRKFSWKRHQLRVQLDALNHSGKNYEVIRFYPMPGRNYKFSINYYL